MRTFQCREHIYSISGMKLMSTVLRASVAMFLLSTFALPSYGFADDLFSFGNDLDRLEVGLSYEDVVSLLGEGELEREEGEPDFSLTYNTGTYAGVHIGFSIEEGESRLTSVLFFDAFQMKTESGIGLGMERAQVRAQIGNPLIHVDIATRKWESYHEKGFWVHVEYDLDGIVTNLYKVDRSRVIMPED